MPTGIGTGKNRSHHNESTRHQSRTPGSAVKFPNQRGSDRSQEDRPICPAWLDDSAKSLWRWLVPQMAERGLITRIDRELLARYCQTVSQWRRHNEVLQTEGDVYTMPSGQLALRPEAKLNRQLNSDLLAMEKQLGLTPEVRSAAGSNGGGGKQGFDLDSFLANGN